MTATYAQAQVRVTQAAQIMAASPLAGPPYENPRALNTALAMLAMNIAAHHITHLANDTYAAEYQQVLREATKAYVDNIPTHHWIAFLQPVGPEGRCCAYDDAAGQISHWCPGIDDERPLPCLACPLIARPPLDLTGPFRPTDKPATQPKRKPNDHRNAAHAANRGFDALAHAVISLPQQPIQHHLAGTVLAIGEAAYYILAAIDHDISRATNSPHRNERAAKPYEKRYHQICDLIYALFNPEDPASISLADENPPSRCTRCTDSTDPAPPHTFICDSPTGEIPADILNTGGLTRELCQDCPFHTKQHRRLPSELIPAVFPVDAGMSPL